MTGIEVIGAILVIGVLMGALSGGERENATKTKACLVCVETETSTHMDVDQVTVPNLHEVKHE